MRRLLFFMLVSLDGYFEGPNHDIGWHAVDEEFNDFAIRQLESVDLLLFGRVTYELMASYWPTPEALRDDPVVAGKMNGTPKVVFSRTLAKAGWQNTRLVTTDAAREVVRLKREPGKDMIIFGSSDLTASLIPHGLIDEFRVMVGPIVLGAGKPLFAGLKERLPLKLVKTTKFRTGNVLLYYRPEKAAG